MVYITIIVIFTANFTVMDFNERDIMLNERDKSLLEAYNAVLKKHGSIARLLPKQVLYEEAVNMPAPRFYISPEHGGRIISNQLKGKTDPDELKKIRAKKE